jgi:hypothetical protein
MAPLSSRQPDAQKHVSLCMVICVLVLSLPAELVVRRGAREVQI